MGLIEQIPIIGPAAYYLLPFLLVLGVVVAVHEYGHYIVAKWCGVHSDVFSLGFGPELFGWVDKHDTRWKVCLIPLGGYVKFRGDADAASAQEDSEAMANLTEEQLAASFPRASLPRRAAIVAAGPIFNFVLAAFLLAGVAMIAGVQSNNPVVGTVIEETEGAKAGFLENDRIITVDGVPVEEFSDFSSKVADETGQTYQVEIERDGARQVIPFTYKPAIILSRVTSGSAAADAGIEDGDEIVSIDGEEIDVFQQLRDAVIAAEGGSLEIGVRRNGEPFTFTLTPRETEIRDGDGEIVTRWLIGVQTSQSFGLGSQLERLGPVEALSHGVRGTTNVITNTLFFIYEMFAGRGDVSDLGGPIRIAEVSGDAAGNGFADLIQLMAILSASIGLINLFPIPVLDGGHLLFYAIEAIRGKPMNARMQEVGLTIGLALIVMLMVFATYNDVMRL